MAEIPHKYPLGIIGNCSFLALIDTRAAVRWMCMPKFDSSFLFGSLLDEERGGRFTITPDDGPFHSHQYYLENTNVLVTEFEGADYKFRVIDFAPRFQQYGRYYRPLMMVRIIEPVSGRPRITVTCKPTGDYGKLLPEEVSGSNHIRYLNLPSQVRLTTDIPVSHIRSWNSFVLHEKKHLFFTYGIPLEAGIAATAEDFYYKTKSYWRNWVKNTNIPAIFQKEIIRSALVLKLHQYEDTGAIIASGTASLPENPGTGRNWDYRYCWLRDAYYTLTAFNQIGHFEELEQYFRYIQNVILNEDHRLQPLYAITREKELTESILDLAGYLGNQPVRIGNDAYTHIQNDSYGQVLVSLLPLFTDARLKLENANDSLMVIHWLLDIIHAKMDEADAGLWEFRNHKGYHCYTYLFHWVGSKAAYRIGFQLNDHKLMQKAQSLCKMAEERIESCYDPERQVYTQAIGQPHLDASCLQLITLNYLNYNSERAAKHLKALENELRSGSGLFFRYRHADDFGVPQSTFLFCAFWYVEALACVGRTEEAISTFGNLLRYSNHLGLFSEDAGLDGSQWGNFPQAYCHVGLINAAFRIAGRLDRPLFM